MDIDFRKMAEEMLQSMDCWGSFYYTDRAYDEEIDLIATALRDTHNKAVEECANEIMSFPDGYDPDVVDAIRRLRKE